MSRADRQTETAVQVEYYADFSIDFAKNPITGNLAMLTNDNSIKQSIKLLVLTVLGEWPHDNRIGSQVNRALFEPDDAITQSAIQETVTEVINNHEKRAKVLQVSVIPYGDNGIGVNIVFSIVNTGKMTSVAVILKRVR